MKNVTTLLLILCDFSLFFQIHFFAFYMVVRKFQFFFFLTARLQLVNFTTRFTFSKIWPISLMFKVLLMIFSFSCSYISITREHASFADRGSESSRFSWSLRWVKHINNTQNTQYNLKKAWIKFKEYDSVERSFIIFYESTSANL